MPAAARGRRRAGHGYGKDNEQGKASFKSLEKLVLSKLGEPTPKSGKQEYLENLLNTYLHG